MSVRNAIRPVVAAVGLCLHCAAQESSPPRELTARELFFTPAAKPVRPAQTAAAKPPAPKPARPAPQVAARPARPAPQQQAPTQVQPSAPDGAAIVPAAMRRTAPPPPAGSDPPLGLRYIVTKLVDGNMLEVAPDSVFRSGDRIRITVVPNAAGYLYIVSQGSSGTWKPIFPSAEIAGGDNRVEGFRDYAMPPKSRLIFDSQPGTERLFVVLSRQPEPDFEQIIYSLQAPKPATPASEPAARPEPPRTLVAASIGNDVVGRMRNVYARDLVIETVDEQTPGDRKEKAVYVVNPSGSAQSRVVADIALVHR